MRLRKLIWSYILVTGCVLVAVLIGVPFRIAEVLLDLIRASSTALYLWNDRHYYRFSAFIWRWFRLAERAHPDYNNPRSIV